MKVLIVALSMCLHWYPVFSQHSVKIRYSINELAGYHSAYEEPRNTRKVYLVWVFNDSLSVTYYQSKQFNPVSPRKGPLGSYYLPKATFTVSGDSLSYRYVYITSAPKRKRWRIMPKVTTAHTWSYLKGEKEILGYTVNPAVAITGENNMRDTILVWYSKSLLSGDHNMPDYLGLQGAPLEIQDQRGNRHYRAETIEISNEPLVFPKHFPTITEDEFRRILSIEKPELYRRYIQTK